MREKCRLVSAECRSSLVCPALRSCATGLPFIRDPNKDLLEADFSIHPVKKSRQGAGSTSAIRLQQALQTYEAETLMGVEPPLRLAIVWRTDPYRCEYWKSPGRPGHVRLYEGSVLRGIRVAGSVDEMRAAAAVWRSELPSPAGADRRVSAERRASTHSGRRSTDPIKTCCACGLPVGPQQHRSPEDCAVAMLRNVG
jgi:hypothetical protein